MQMYVINGTDYVWAASEDSARHHFEKEVQDEPIASVDLLPDEAPIYVQEPADGGEALWWVKKHAGWNVLEESTVGKFFASYCRGVELPFIVHSTNW